VREAQEFSAKGDFLLAVAIGDESVGSDSHELFGEDVEEESAKELHSVKGHGSSPAAVPVVLPPEADLVIIEGEESLVNVGRMTAQTMPITVCL